jgi:predicted phage tail protein
LLSKIKIHSSLSHLFSEKKLVADLTHYSDIPRYLGAMHPRFAAYAQKSYLGEIDEGYFILDKKLVPLTNNDFIIKRIKKDDEFYVVPAICGGGGKKTSNLLKIAAIATAAFVVGPQIAAAFSGGGGAALGMSPGAMGGAIGAGATSTAAATGGIFGTGITASTLAVNAGLALVTSLFTQSPESIKSTDQAVRANDMFGSLQSTISSGTPIPLIYGMHRTAGHLVSGHIDAVEHGKNDLIRVVDQF